MPLYATRCTASDHRKDVLVRSHASDLPACTCGAPRERLVSAPGFVLKGQGWYDKGRPAAPVDL
jgi:putative FmdB family regulatory protein